MNMQNVLLKKRLTKGWKMDISADSESDHSCLSSLTVFGQMTSRSFKDYAAQSKKARNFRRCVAQLRKVPSLQITIDVSFIGLSQLLTW